MIEYIEEDIKEVMEITGLDKVKAEKLFKSVAKDIDDGSDDEICSYDVIDIIKTEQKVKENGCDRHYVQGDKPKTERKPRERKVDNEKLALLKMLASGLTDSNIEVAFENEVKLHFNYNGSSYSVTLTKHRPPKKQAVCVNYTKIILALCTKAECYFYAKLPLDKTCGKWYNGGPRTVAAGRISIITYTLVICQVKNCTKILPMDSQNQ